MCGHGEGQPNVHAGRKAFDGGVEKTADLGEGDDLLEIVLDLGVLHAEDGAIEVNVLAAGQLTVKAGSHLEQTPHAAVKARTALGRLRDTGEDLQQSGFSGAVAADDSEAGA